jgi:RHS repeat-associated protein
LLGTGASGNKISRADVGGTNINLAFIATAVGPTGLTSDANFLYWSNYTNSTIGRAALNGTGVDQAYVVSPSTAAADLLNPVGIAVNGSYVYMTNLDLSKIGRAAFAGAGDQLTIFLDGQEVVNNPGSATVVSAARYYSGSGLLATRTTYGGLTYVGTDPQGTLTATLTTAGVFTRQRYKPFGEQRGSGAQLNALPSERGFVGQVEDTATGLSYLNARHYDARNGVFTSVDPVLKPAEAPSLNGYIYGRNNPTSFSDPTGLEPGSWCNTSTCGLRNHTPDKQTTVTSTGKGDDGPNLLDEITGGEPSDYQDFVAKVSKEAGVDPILAYAILLNEHNGDFPGKNAVNAVGEALGVADSYGIMNVSFGAFKAAYETSGGKLEAYLGGGVENSDMETKWERLSYGDVGSDKASIAAGIYYLKYLSNKLKNVNVPDGYTKSDVVAAAYNAGPENIITPLKRGTVSPNGETGSFGRNAIGYMYATAANYKNAYKAMCDGKHRTCK